MSLYFIDAVLDDNISPFCIHPDVNKVYKLSEFGFAFIIKNGDDQNILEDFCKDTSLTKDDFTKRYIYYGEYLYTTDKQTEFANDFVKLVENVNNSGWYINTMIYKPVNQS
jgi:hypothetical protein